MNKIDIPKSDRIQVIDALRGYAPVLVFHSLLKYSTPALKALLCFYQEGGNDREIPGFHIAPRRGIPIVKIELVEIDVRKCFDGIRTRA